MGKILVEIDASVQYVINILSQNQIKVNSFSGSRPVRFLVDKDNFYKAKEVFTRLDKEIKVVRDGTFSTFFRRNIQRAGIFVALALIAVFCYFYSLKVTNIVINGNSIVDTDKILDTVYSCYDLPANRQDIDTMLIEKEVTKMDMISSSSVYIKGKTLFCAVFEELPKVEVIDKSDFTPMVSLYDAIVTRIIVFDGTAIVRSGDTVKKGQTLIEAKKVIDEEKGLYAETKPLGEVYGRVWETKTEIFYPTIIRRVRTGRSKSTVRFFDDDFAEGSVFTLYEREIREEYYDGVIPFKIYVATDYEVEEREEEFDFEANADGIIKEGTEELENSLPSDCEKVRTWFEIKRLDKTVRLDIYYEIEIKIF